MSLRGITSSLNSLFPPDLPSRLCAHTAECCVPEGAVSAPLSPPHPPPSFLCLFFSHSETRGSRSPQISLPSPGLRLPRLPLAVLLDSPSTSWERVLTPHCTAGETEAQEGSVTYPC